MQARYFIGIALPGELSRAIVDFQNELPVSSKLMKPLVPHITLLHPNLLSHTPAEALRPQIGEAAKAFLPLEIQLTGTSQFGKQVLYIDVNCAEISTLQKMLLQLLSEENREGQSDNRPFIPHITLMQAKRKQILPEQQTKILSEKIGSLLPCQFQVEQLALFTWIKPGTYRVDTIHA